MNGTRMLYLISLLPILAIPPCAIRQQAFHPFARSPGPFWASLPGLWRAYHEFIGDASQTALWYHRRYGHCMRTALNELHFDTADVVDVVHKQSLVYSKSEFYDGVNVLKPNFYGTRDEHHHAVRQRQLAGGFSAPPQFLAGIGISRHCQSFARLMGYYQLLSVDCSNACHSEGFCGSNKEMLLEIM